MSVDLSPFDMPVIDKQAAEARAWREIARLVLPMLMRRLEDTERERNELRAQVESMGLHP